MNGSSYVAKPPQYVLSWPTNISLPHGPSDALLSQWFDFFMDVRVPVTIAAVYATLVHAANHVRKTNKEPISFAKTSLFKYLVLAHNMGLCVYSAWTCWGMTGAIYQSVFSATQATMGSAAAPDKLAQYLKGETDLMGGGFWRQLCDVNEGIWENGLSYYGFFFYLSKFYEVVDTMIILAKGKQSSMLQTYHHAGAMLSMWAGIRFASPPIWIFVVFNSLIHTLMYFYYTLSALKIRVPTALKRALTTAQICQFIFGGSFASLHMFIYYFNPSTGSYASCMANPGQSFALLFNVFYLAPLTYLFVNFWIESYVKARKRAAAKKTQ